MEKCEPTGLTQLASWVSYIVLACSKGVKYLKWIMNDKLNMKILVCKLFEKSGMNRELFDVCFVELSNRTQPSRNS